MRIPCIIITLFFTLSAHSQQWSWARKASITFSSQIAIKTTADKYGNVYSLARNESNAVYGTSTLTPGCFIVSHDKSGTLRWCKNIPGNAVDVTADISGNIFIVGNFTNSVSFANFTYVSNGGQDLYILKLSSAGSPLWLKAFGGKHEDAVKALCTGVSGSIYFTGYSSDTISFGSYLLTDTIYRNFFITSMDPAGVVKWANTDTDGSASGDFIATDKNETVYVIGNGGGYCMYCYWGFLSKYSPSGNRVFTKKNWGVFEGPYGLAVDDDLNIYTIYNDGSHYTTSLNLAKYDPQLNSLWHTYIGQGYDGYRLQEGLSVDLNGDAYVGGVIGPSGYGKFDSVKLGSKWFTTKGGIDLLVAKFNGSTGSYAWCKTAGGTGNDGSENSFVFPGSMYTDRFGNTYVTGDFHVSASSTITSCQDKCSFDSDTICNDNTWRQVFVAKLKGSDYSYPNEPTGVSENAALSKKLVMFPNPSSSGIFGFKITGQAPAFIRVFNLSGSCVHEEKLNGDSDLNLSNQQKGIYIIELKIEEQILREKIIIE